jgi:putative protease
MKEIEIGKVADFFQKIGVVAVEITSGEVSVGDTIRFLGHTTDFSQKIESMQIEHDSVQTAKPGDNVGIKVSERVRIHDKVFKVVED